MRTVQFAAAAAILVLIAPASIAKPSPAGDAMKAAMRTAKAQKKAILVLFGASW